MDPVPPNSASSGTAPDAVSGSIRDGAEVPPRAEGPGGSEVDPLDPGAGGGFMGATLDELSRVVWPSRQQLFSESVGVILMVALSAAAIAAIDRFYSWASSQVFR